MKYRHAFHAGNFADVMKHAALVAALSRLTEKDRPLFLLDTHAGRGRYELADAGAEAERGIARVAAAGIETTHPALARYLAIVRGMNQDGRIRAYPGSPLIEAALMRAGDRAAFCELLAGEADALRGEFRGDARFGVHCRDGFEALAALLPPPEKRGLALIDPPYEEQERDIDRVADALLAAAARWPQGVLMAWYPIKLGVSRRAVAPADRGCRREARPGRGTVRAPRRLARRAERLGARDAESALAVSSKTCGGSCRRCSPCCAEARPGVTRRVALLSGE